MDRRVVRCHHHRPVSCLVEHPLERRPCRQVQGAKVIQCPRCTVDQGFAHCQRRLSRDLQARSRQGGEILFKEAIGDANNHYRLVVSSTLRSYSRSADFSTTLRQTLSVLSSMISMSSPNPRLATSSPPEVWTSNPRLHASSSIMEQTLSISPSPHSPSSSRSTLSRHSSSSRFSVSACGCWTSTGTTLSSLLSCLSPSKAPSSGSASVP